MLMLAMLSACGVREGGAGAPQAAASAATQTGPAADMALRAELILLKSAVQANPNSAAARYKLGIWLLAQGDARGAEVELQRAEDANYNTNETIPALARARLEQGKYQMVLTNFAETKLTDAKAIADLQVTLANAHTALGSNSRARQALSTALRAMPSYSPAILLNARFVAASGQPDEAMRLVEELLSREADYASAWQFKGDLLRGLKRDDAGAVAAYERALQVDPGSLETHAVLIAWALGSGDLEEAQRRLAALKKVAPQHLQTMYFEARCAEQAGDLTLAAERARSLLTLDPENPRFLVLSATVEMRTGSLLSAQSYLSKVISTSPRLVHPRLLLAEVHLRQGDAARAEEMLLPLLGRASTNSAAMSLAAEAKLLAGDPKGATRLYERAAAIDPTNARARTALAMAQIARGDISRGFGELEDLAAGDKGGFADLALIGARLQTGNRAAALKAIDNLEKKLPRSPLPLLLRGRIELAAGKADTARQAFERALQLDKAFAPATMQLADMDIADRQFARARERFEGILARDHTNLDARLAVAELRSAEGMPAEQVAAMLQEIARDWPGVPRVRVALVNHLLRSGETKAAMSAAQAADATLPEDFEVGDALGRAQMADGEIQQALRTFGRIAAMRPDSAGPWLRMAEAHNRDQDADGALEALTRAVQIEPNQVANYPLLVGLAIQERRWPQAQAVARGLQRRRPALAMGYQLEAHVLAAQQKWPEAIQAFTQALSRGASGDAAARMHVALQSAGRKDEAQRFADNWERDRPRDAAFLAYRGDVALAAGDLAGAERRYSEVIRIDERNEQVHNNLAWTLLRQGKPNAAAHAERANALRPNQPGFMDTLALALAADGRFAHALEVQRRAVVLAPNQHELKLHLAQIALRAGDKRGALEALAPLEALGKKFPAQSEVGRLLTQAR